MRLELVVYADDGAVIYSRPKTKIEVLEMLAAEWPWNDVAEVRNNRELRVIKAEKRR